MDYQLAELSKKLDHISFFHATIIAQLGHSEILPKSRNISALFASSDNDHSTAAAARRLYDRVGLGDGRR